MFQKARDSAPCVIFFDELDSLCPRRSESREVIYCVIFENTEGYCIEYYYSASSMNMWLRWCMCAHEIESWEF